MDACGRSSGGCRYECLLFDMDDTLYPLSSGLNLACRKNIEEFMLQHLHIDENEVPKMCLDLYKEYGTTMAGLKALGYEFDNDEFHTYVHGKLPYEALKPDLLLRHLLLSMPQRKIVFTNADKAHAAQVLNKLSLEDCFEGVICFETLNPPPLKPDHDDNYNTQDRTDEKQVLAKDESEGTATDDTADSSRFSSKPPILCKPSVEAIEAAIRIAKADPKKTIFFDDSTRNIASGKAAGLHTVIVGSTTLVPGADHALSSIHNIKEALPEIWEGEGEQLEQVIHLISHDETSVIA
ncbi:uncharacterized protein C24B11.05 isoform X2 [Rhododendron vialii]|uniref:uncharacterized protein C24B11.05 isoform X2 n=1 Tax=Rhododendron vialii TaxID=182163 RepID=UPI00265FDCF1|nr:uncharacterized protein C24B11.05 isoform X2 [Rhododendron vialii]XP_058227694.1 uncharacterized protein C24B11.05 isoform X2 [Rhododendron vialii]